MCPPHRTRAHRRLEEEALSQALCAACARGQAGAATLLLVRGGRGDARTAAGDLPLAAAAGAPGAGGLACVRALLGAGADPAARCSRGRTALMYAAVATATGDSLDALLAAPGGAGAAGAADADGRTALHFAAACGVEAAVAALVRAGAPVGARDGAGEAPLHAAVVSAAPPPRSRPPAARGDARVRGSCTAGGGRAGHGGRAGIAGWRRGRGRA